MSETKRPEKASETEAAESEVSIVEQMRAVCTDKYPDLVSGFNSDAAELVDRFNKKIEVIRQMSPGQSVDIDRLLTSAIEIWAKEKFR